MSNITTGTLKSPVDGLELSTILGEADSPRGVVQIVHGMAEHKERYIPFIEYLVKNGYNCIISDIRGHGDSVKSQEDLGYFYKGGGKAVIKDMVAICKFAKSKWPGLPVFMLGHSMGSLATRVFLKKYSRMLDGAILSGPPTKQGAIGAAKLLCAVNTLFCGSRHRSKLIDGLAFGKYNEGFDDSTEQFRWLSTNKENVARYTADPKCGYVFTDNGFKGLFYLQQKAYTGGWKKKNKGMPLCIFCGGDDPCVGGEKKLNSTVKFLKDKKFKVSAQTYPGLRHEILNETGNQQVYRDMLGTLNQWTPKNAEALKNKKYIIALDQGTTSSRAIVFDRNKNIVSMAQKEFAQHYPKPGYVEHDAEEIYNTQMSVLAEALRKGGIKPAEVAAIGITNQRETTVMWDKKTGKPVYNAIVWQCRRTAEMCDRLKERGLAPMIQQKTGLIVDAYFSATKIKWLLENVKGLRQRAENGEILFGTIDTWLIWKMTGGKAHVTDYTNASRTMLFNINTLQWDKDILRLLDIPACILPEVVSSSRVNGTYEIGGVKIPIAGVAGDQQASLFGQGCFEEGDAKNTYGTGCFMLMNTGKKPMLSDNGLLSTIGIGIEGHMRYAVEGSVFVGGAVIQWLRDELKILSNASQSEQIATSLKDNGGVYFVPAFTGLGAPYWDMYARGAIYGITRGTKREHIIRAAVESMAFQSDDLIKAFESATGLRLKELKVDGGASANNFLMQFQSDISNLNIIRPATLETTALGAALLAGIGVGLWTIDDLKQSNDKNETFKPTMNDAERSALKENWKTAVSNTLTNK
ncbi:MAG: glycerol kinase GlpK [Clostridia bacterium]|nr:glycerol kinase GlpK [Clostridia bacterium]